MSFSPVTAIAVQVQHEYVARMPVRVAEGQGTLSCFLGMAVHAGLPGPDPTVFLADATGVASHKGHEHPILLKKAHAMTGLADHAIMPTDGPGFLGFLHEVTKGAEIRIALGIGIVAASDDNGQRANQQNEYKKASLPFHEGRSFFLFPNGGPDLAAPPIDGSSGQSSLSMKEKNL